MRFISISGIFADIGDAIVDGIASVLYAILLWINCIIYSFISFVYQMFLVLAGGGQIFDDNVLSDFISRVYVVVGVVVLFLVAYSLLKNMIDPDKAMKDKKGPANVIKDVLISIVLIAFVPTIFQFAFDLQNSLLTNNTIGKLVVGASEGTAAETIRDGGYIMASTVWQAFLRPTEDENGDPYCNNLQEENDDTNDCVPLDVNGVTYGELWEVARQNTSFYSLIGLQQPISQGKITYYFFVDIIAGIYVLIVLLDYCLKMAIRLVKLAAFELIAPLPILARILPNEQGNKVFSNWVKATLSTFLEVFIMIAILFFAVMMVTAVTGSIDNLFTGGALASDSTTTPLVKVFAQALIVIGIIKFVKEAPGIIKDITGLDGGKYGKALMRGIGMFATSLGGGTTAAIRSFASDKDKPLSTRIGRAATAGFKGNLQGLRKGAKVEKFKDIPKMAGQASTQVLGYRAAVETAGGYKAYYKQKRNDRIEMIKDWAGGNMEILKAEKEVNDKILAVVDNVKKVAEDFMNKHEHEYFVFDGSQAEKDAKKARWMQLNADAKAAEASGNAAQIQAAKDAIDDFQKHHASERLDVIKKQILTEEKNGNHVEAANLQRKYDKARKDELDGFVTSSHYHYGAEKEAAKVSNEMKTMELLVKENSTSTAVQFLTQGSTEHGLAANNNPLNNDTAAKYFKDIKTAAEYSNADIGASLEEKQRREERRKANNPSGDK